MAAIRTIEAAIGDIIEGTRRYEVVDDREDGLALEPAITKTVAEMHAEHGTRGLSLEEFEELFGDLPTDREG